MSFECHAAFLANVPVHSASPADTTKRIHSLPRSFDDGHDYYNNDYHPHHQHRSMSTSTTTTTAATAPLGQRSMSVDSKTNLGGRKMVSTNNNNQSFADFFSTTNPVPTSVTLMLTYTAPTIHSFAVFLQLLTWTSDRSTKSFLVLFSWWAICLGIEALMVFGLHWVVLGYIGLQWIQSRRMKTYGKSHNLQDQDPLSPLTPIRSNSDRSGFFSASSIQNGIRYPVTSQLDQAETLREIQEIVDHLADWKRSLHGLKTSVDWSDPTQTFGIAVFVILSYIPWVISLQFLIPTRVMVMIVGSLVICWRAPWFQILMAVGKKLQGLVQPVLEDYVPFWPWKDSQRARYYRRRATKFSVKGLIARAMGQSKKVDRESVVSEFGGQEEDHATMYYKFVLYENQRWWLGLEWTPVMLPNDRSPWTDDHLEPTQSKSSFQLPPIHIAHEPITGQPTKILRKSQEWRWLDPHWRLKTTLANDGTSVQDKDGWEYANNHWQKWSGKNHRGAYTRRRAWERTAQLIDQREIMLLKDVEKLKMNGEVAVVEEEDAEGSEFEEEGEEEEEEGEEDEEEEEEEEEQETEIEAQVVPQKTS